MSRGLGGASPVKGNRRGGGFALEPQHLITHTEVAQVFAADRDKDGSYQDDRDPTMEAPAMLERRRKLREHPAVVDALHRVLSLFRADAEGNVAREEYFRAHGTMVAALLPNATEEDAARWTQEDWEKDAGAADAPSIPSSALLNAMFELVDHWTVTAAPEEYIAFADALVFHAKYPGQRDPAAYDVLASSPAGAARRGK